MRNLNDPMLSDREEDFADDYYDDLEQEDRCQDCNSYELCGCVEEYSLSDSDEELVEKILSGEVSIDDLEEMDIE